MKKAEALTINLPAPLWHPTHAAVHPVLCEERSDLARLLEQGWFLSYDDMVAGRANVEDAEDASIEEERDEVDDMLDEENNSGDASAPKKRTKKKK
jgi:hypothetical protein